MRKCDSTIKMAYEMKHADKFDDIVLFDDGKKEIHLIQAKHGNVKDGKIKDVGLDALFPTTGINTKRNNDFDLCKYIKSYLNVIHKLGGREYKMTFYIFTNKDLVFTNNEWVNIREDQVKDMLHFPGPQARHLKLHPTRKAFDEISKYINKDIIVVKDAIVECLNNERVSKTLKDYCTPLREVLTIERNEKCRFAESFKADNEQFSVAQLYRMLQNESFDMQKEATVNDNFLIKESKLKFLPPYVSEDEIGAFFRNFMLSVGQPNDLRPIIDSELLAWMKSWIWPDILGQLDKEELGKVYTALRQKFDQCNQPINGNSKQFLKKSNIEVCLDVIQNEMKKLMRNRTSVEELDKIYVNRQIKYVEEIVTTDGMDSAIGNSEMQRIQIDRWIRDTEFVEKLRGTFQTQQHILLVAEPGMGKTSLLQMVAFDVQKHDYNTVFLVYFRSLMEKLEETETVSNLNDVLKILCVALSQENCDVIRNAPEERNGTDFSVVLILDGFDEIHTNYIEKVKNMIRYLSSKKSIQIITSSRMHLKTSLEKTLEVRSMLLEPFSDEDQIRYLKKVWNVSEEVEPKFVHFAKLLLEKFHSSTASNLSEISGLPLMMRMLAEIYSDKFQLHISAESTDDLQSDFSEDEMSIVYLYEKFVVKCFSRKFKEMYQPQGPLNDGEINSLIKGYIEEHQLLAMHLLRIEILKDLLKNENHREKFEQFITRCKKESEKSLLVKLVNNNVQFCHHSYSEYFVAKYLCDHMFTFKENLIDIWLKHSVIRQFSMTLLEEKKANFDILSDLCKTEWKVALWACESNCLKMVSSLKKNFNNFSISNLNMMLKASAKNGCEKVCQFLIDYNESLDKCGALLSAAENGQVKIANRLLSCNTNVNCRSLDGKTALHIAAQNGQVKFAEFLIERKADPNVVDKDQKTALHIAAQYGCITIVELLLCNRVNVNAKEKTNHLTALHLAARYGHAELVKLLANRGATTNSRSLYGLTPLHFAAWNGHSDIVAFFLDNNSNANEVDQNEWTALHMAAEAGHAQVVTLLLNRGANISSRTIEGLTALHIAAPFGYDEVVKILLDRGADPNSRNKDGQTPLDNAKRNGQLNIVELLEGITTAVEPSVLQKVFNLFF